VVIALWKAFFAAASGAWAWVDGPWVDWPGAAPAGTGPDFCTTNICSGRLAAAAPSAGLAAAVPESLAVVFGWPSEEGLAASM
jgi:hypothetical protein